MDRGVSDVIWYRRLHQADSTTAEGVKEIPHNDKQTSIFTINIGKKCLEREKTHFSGLGKQKKGGNFWWVEKNVVLLRRFSTLSEANEHYLSTN